MKVLIADDDKSMLRLMDALLSRSGYETIKVADGEAALQVLTTEKEPLVALLDWNMPGLTGVEICSRLSRTPSASPSFIILLTGKNDKASVLQGLEAGADDYVTKPFDRDELRARIKIGARMVGLRQALSHRVRELEDALANIKRLQGLLPMCAWCRKIRNDKDYWQALDSYVQENTGAKFSHGICPDCAARVRKENQMRKQSERKTSKSV